MADLSKLFMKKATPDAATTTAAIQDSHDVVDSGQPEQLPSTESSASAQPAAVVNPFARKPSGGTGSAQPSGSGVADSGHSGGDPVDSQPRPALANAFARAAAQPTTGPSESLVPETIGSLDDLANTIDAGTPSRDRVAFADETPADKPTRELPADMTKESLGFVDLIDGVYEVIHEPDMMGQIVRNIIIELGTHPEYMKLVAPDDIRVWVRGMRESMGLAKVKKIETKARKPGAKSKVVDNDMLADLASLGINV